MSSISYNFQRISSIVPYKILTYDKLKYQNDWSSIIHTHPHCELLIVTHGEGWFSNGEEKTHVRKGYVVITNRFIPHTEYSDLQNTNSPMQYVVFSLSNIDFYLVNTRTVDVQKSFIFDMSTIWSDLNAYLMRLDKEIDSAQTYWDTICKNIIDEIIILIMRRAKLNDFCIQQSSPAQKNVSLVEIAKNYMDRNYPFNIGIDDLAAKVYLNKFHFMHSFKKITGVSPMQYLAKVRIDKAKDLLHTTDFSVTDIAMQTGFSSTSNFCKKFKLVTNISPMQFKKISQT